MNYGGWLGVSSAARTEEKAQPSVALNLNSFYFYNLNEKQQDYYSHMNEVERNLKYDEDSYQTIEIKGMDDGWDRLNWWDHLEHLYLPGEFDLLKLHRKDMNHLQAVHFGGERFEMLSANDTYDQTVFKLYNKMKHHNYLLEVIGYGIDSAEMDLDNLEV